MALRDEWRALVRETRALDAQTVTVLLGSVALVFLQFHLGNRRFYFGHIAPHMPAEWVEIGRWLWWFGTQGLTGFVVPVLLLMFVFKRTPREIGLGLGDWKLALGLGAAYVPLVAAGTWVLSAQPAFQMQYPHFGMAAFHWDLFLYYQIGYLMYWLGWEYLWRGFVLFGAAPKFGTWAIILQAVPFALLHLDKPAAEAYLSILGGVALGALCWRCRSFWIAVPLHSVQMLLLDFFCTFRARTGTQGFGWEAISALFTGWW